MDASRLLLRVAAAATPNGTRPKGRAARLHSSPSKNDGKICLMYRRMTASRVWWNRLEIRAFVFSIVLYLLLHLTLYCAGAGESCRITVRRFCNLMPKNDGRRRSGALEFHEKSVKMALTISVFAVILYAQQWSRTYSRSHRAEPALPVNMLANFFCVYCAGIFCPRT